MVKIGAGLEVSTVDVLIEFEITEPKRKRI
jgi:hypothetical protein